MSFSLKKDFCDTAKLLPWQCDITLVLSIIPLHNLVTRLDTTYQWLAEWQAIEEFIDNTKL